MSEEFNGQLRSPAEAGVHEEDFLRLLVCPSDHGRLTLDGQVLVCSVCKRQYPIEDGVPNMLLDDD